MNLCSVYTSLVNVNVIYNLHKKPCTKGMLKEPKAECIIMACFGPDALDPNISDPPNHPNQMWAGFAQHDLGLPWKNETELDHVGNHIWHDSGCRLAIMAISKMLPNQILHVYRDTEHCKITSKPSKQKYLSRLVPFNGHKQNASKTDPACLQGMRDTEHCKITSKPSKQKCLTRLVLFNVSKPVV